MEHTGTMLERWWATVDGYLEGEPAELLADDVQWTITFAGTTRGGGRDELLAYVRDRISEGRRHHIRFASVAGPVEIVAGELLEHGEPLATFVATAERDREGRMTRYIAAASTDIRLSLPRPPQS